LTLAEVAQALGIDSDLRKYTTAVSNEARKRAIRKIGCEVAKAVTVQGVYVLVLGNGNFYVGQSKDIARRFGEHVRDLEKAGARIVGMLKITTGIESSRAQKYLREIFEAALIKELNPAANVIRNPIANVSRFLKYSDPVQAGVDKLFKVTPLCR
jgi:predicted GIY-YIG superfamily endonuclease